MKDDLSKYYDATKIYKRVYCLYRVSNPNRVDNDDIPMQKKACHLFASAHFGWVIRKEFYEKGISGYSVIADDRDSIIELREAAINKEFDVLLVFMFDRLGRIDNETPFVLKWFVEQGIEVWSVKEGQQTFTTHEDDLVNYIYYCAANVESAKTSQRVSTRLRQMVETGSFIGGVLPFGYQWIDSDVKNKHGDTIKKPIVIPEEADIVKYIFESTEHRNIRYGSLAKEINGMGVVAHRGTKFSADTIKRILSNPLYCGFLVRGGVISPRHEELQIIDDDLYNRAQEIIQQRSERYARKKRTLSYKQKSRFCRILYIVLHVERNYSSLPRQVTVLIQKVIEIIMFTADIFVPEVL